MNLRKEYLILGVLIVVLSVYLLFRNGDRSLYELPVMDAIEAADITRIEIEKPDEHIVLYRKDSGAWTAGQAAYPADEAKCRRMIDTIRELTITALAAESQSFERYQLDPARKIRVTAWNGNQKLRGFDVGKNASASRHTFIRLAGDHRVFHARGNLRRQFETTLDDVRDKTVLAFDKDQIHTVRIENGNRSAMFVKEMASDSTGQHSSTSSNETGALMPEWKTIQGESVNGGKLNILLDQLARLSCKQFVYNHIKTDYTNPLFTITLEGADSYTLSIFKQMTMGEADYPAISSPTGYPFLLPKWQADKIMLNPDDMQPFTVENRRRQG